MKVELWIARDKHQNRLWIHNSKPRKIGSVWVGQGLNHFAMMIDNNLFPEVQWEDKEPTEVELKIVKK